MPAESPGSGRRPPEHVAPVWYGLALVAYVVIGYFYKPVLMHWTLGSLFLLFALYIVPTAGRAAWNRLRPGRSA